MLRVRVIKRKKEENKDQRNRQGREGVLRLCAVLWDCLRPHAERISVCVSAHVCM